MDWRTFLLGGYFCPALLYFAVTIVRQIAAKTDFIVALFVSAAFALLWPINLANLASLKDAGVRQ